MKVDYRLITVLGMCVSMAIFGCAREQANLSGSGSLSTGTASQGTSTSSDLSFNLAGVLPSDAFATLDVTNGGLDENADSEFSIENGFNTDEAAENAYVYWYVNWTQPNPETNASDPVLGQECIPSTLSLLPTKYAISRLAKVILTGCSCKF